jgi:hypothetical protein
MSIRKMNIDGANVCNNTQHLKAIVDAYALKVKDYLVMGWDGYIFTVMFHHLSGPRDTKLVQMNQEVERIYNRLGTRMVRNPRSPKWTGHLPVGVFIPDLPVPKSRNGKKSTIADVSINDGLHIHGILLANRWGRIRQRLEDYFERNVDHFATGRVRSIHVEPITYRPEKAVRYVFKSLLRRTATPDDVRVLNWGGSAHRPDIIREALRKFLKQGRAF